MDPDLKKAILKQKLAANVADLPKMASAKFIGFVGLVWTVYLTLPEACAPGAAAACLSQASILESIRPLFAWIPPPIFSLGATVLGIYFRIKPRLDLGATVRVVSVDTGPPPIDHTGTGG